MLTLIATALLSGNCVQRVVTHSYAAPVVAQYQYQVVPLYVPQVYDDSQRIRRLEDAIEQLTVIATQQQQLIQQNVQQVNGSAFESQAKGVIARNCLGCHGQQNPKAGLDLTRELTIGEKLLVAEAVAGDSMPPNKPLSNEDKKVLWDWSRENKADVKAFLLGR